MKRIVLFLLPVLILAMAGCGDVLTTAQMLSAVQTLTATVLPPTPTATPDPDENAIVMLLNRGLEQTLDPLSQTIDAHYQVMDASFPLGISQQAATFQVNVRCECYGASCCTPERTFVVIVNAMKPGIEKIARQVPVSVTSFQVVCQSSSMQIGVLTVAWQDMVDYFSGRINGYQLGARTVKYAGP